MRNSGVEALPPGLQFILMPNFKNQVPRAPKTMPGHTVMCSSHTRSVNTYGVATACLGLCSGSTARAEPSLPWRVWKLVRETDIN